MSRQPEPWRRPATGSSRTWRPRAGGKEAVSASVAVTRPGVSCSPRCSRRTCCAGCRTVSRQAWTPAPVSAGRYTVTVIDPSRERGPDAAQRPLLAHARRRRPDRAAPRSAPRPSSPSPCASGDTGWSPDRWSVHGRRPRRDPRCRRRTDCGGACPELHRQHRSSVMADDARCAAQCWDRRPAVVTDAAAGDSVVTPVANPVLAPSDPGYYPVDRSVRTRLRSPVARRRVWRPAPSRSRPPRRARPAVPRPSLRRTADGAPTTTTPTSAAAAGTAAGASLPAASSPSSVTGRP